MRCAMLITSMLVFAPLVAADELPKPPPEAKILEEFVGTWDEVLTNKESEWLPKAGRQTSVTKKSWALNGMFVKSEGTSEPSKNEFVAYVGYDPHTKVYRQYYFDSFGTMPTALQRGTFDEKNRTFSWSGVDEGSNKIVGKHKLIDKDNQEWTLVITNAEGKVMLDMSGTCKRRK